MRVIVFLSCLCLTLAFSPGRAPEQSPRLIIGGDEAPIGSRPYQVAIYFDESRAPNNMCGGALVHSQWVVTAAHCQSLPPTVHLGQYFLDDAEADGAKVVRGEWIVHPDYYLLEEAIPINDIALIKLDSPVTLTDRIQTIKIASAGSDVGFGTQLLVSGWGYTQSYGDTQERLRQVVVDGVSRSFCNSRYSDYEITDVMFCAAGIFKGPCKQDRGGPVVSDFDENEHVDSVTLQGVVSWGFGCGIPSYPAVYTRISMFCSWLATTTNNDVTC